MPSSLGASSTFAAVALGWPDPAPYLVAGGVVQLLGVALLFAGHLWRQEGPRRDAQARAPRLRLGSGPLEAEAGLGLELIY